MAGFAVYVAIFVLVGFWIVGWAGVSLVAGAFFDVPMGTSSMLGAVLGPIGFIVTILVGVIAKRADSAEQSAVDGTYAASASDPFSLDPFA